MSYAAVPTETVLQIAEHLDSPGVNALLRTSTWHASLLTPVLYNRALGIGQSSEAAQRGQAADPRKPTRGLPRAMWNAARNWKSKYIAEYLIPKRGATFIRPYPGDPGSGRARGHDVELNLLSCMVSAQNGDMVKVLLEYEDVRQSVFEITLTENAEYDLLAKWRRRGTHPLMLAIDNNDVKMFTTLLDTLGGDDTAALRKFLDLDDKLGLGVLGYAIAYPVPSSSRELLDAVVAAVVRAGGDLNTCHGVGPSKHTALWMAASEDDFVAVQALLDAGADLWAVSSGDGQLPVEIALSNEKPDMASLLLKEMLAREAAAGKADTRREAWGGDMAILGWKTCVLYTILRSRYSAMADLVPTLLEAGADILALDSYEKNAIELVEEWARPNSRHETWPAYEKREAQDIASMFLRLVNPERVWLPPPKADGDNEADTTEEKHYVNRRLWHLAASACVEQYHLILLGICIKTGKSALELGPAQPGVTHQEFTALHYICDSIRSNKAEDNTTRDVSDLAMAQLLLDHGANPAAKSTWNETLLLCAARRGRPLIVEALLKYPTVIESIDLVDRTGKTPLRAAVDGAHNEIVRLLVDAGADMARLDETARGLAERLLQGERDPVTPLPSMILSPSHSR